MYKKAFLLILFSLFSTPFLISQQLSYQLNSREKGIPKLPLKLPVKNINLNSDSLLIQAYRIEGEKIVQLKSQLEKGDVNYLWILPDKEILPNKTVYFTIEINKGVSEEGSQNTIVYDEDALVLISGQDTILTYKHSYTPSPEGVDSLYGKSGYIHPLYSPEGNIMTRIQPSDHYHHYGIWNPWTKIRIGEKEIDLWNLAKGLGTVRYGGLISKTSGSLFNSLVIKQEHVEYDSLLPERIIMNETWSIKSFPVTIDKKKCWMIDITIQLNNALNTTIELAKYRYGGGIGFRANEDWTKDNSTVLSSEGKTREDADASHARWCKIEGEFENGTSSGVIFCSHPENRAFPEPMRVWPMDANNGRGDVFFQFCPIRHKSWYIEPNNQYILKYRMLVYDDHFSEKSIEKIWHHFAYPAELSFLNE